MAENVLKLGEGTPEEVAFKLLQSIAVVEGKKVIGLNPITHTTTKKWTHTPNAFSPCAFHRGVSLNGLGTERSQVYGKPWSPMAGAPTHLALKVLRPSPLATATEQVHNGVTASEKLKVFCGVPDDSVVSLTRHQCKEPP
jgi:hypothetical protein